jgi:hypothetical protein
MLQTQKKPGNPLENLEPKDRYVFIKVYLQQQFSHNQELMDPLMVHDLAQLAKLPM